MLHPLLDLALLPLLTGAPGGGSMQVSDPPAGVAWEQGVDYRIEARLDEFRQVLEGRLRLRYANHSSDTLRALYFHLYLNAFRPHSIWAREERRPWLDFGELQDPHHAFERLLAVQVDERAAVPEYPHSPDSTVARVPLARPLPPGGVTVVGIDWRARTSTLPRRQGRAGRHWDFAQWYPKIAVYDRYGWQAKPLHPETEFYGEFATYDVTLELLSDQVLAATGVPVSGDPGWRDAGPPGSSVTYLRGFYSEGEEGAGSGAGAGLGLLAPRPPPGYKRVRWRAERVHHFAWLTDPYFRYEEGRHADAVVRVLYRPEEERAWSVRALDGARRALAWMDTLFGPYPWPQLTIARRIEGGATEFPMLLMQGRADFGLTLHEVGHQYTYGALANNEWKEGWLDEGFTTFQSRRYRERHDGPYGPVPPPSGYTALKPRLTMREDAAIQVLRLDLDGRSQPLTLHADDYSEFLVYDRMVYTKGSLFFDMLRYVLGEETFRRTLRTYYARYRLSHVDGDALRSVAEDVCRCDLSWFFAQWLHGTPLVDYALGRVRIERSSVAGEHWLAKVEVVRKGDGRMPVEVMVSDRSGHEVRVRTPGSAPRELVTLRTVAHPEQVVLDPDDRILDWNRANNRRGSLGGLPLPIIGGAATEAVDWPLLDQVRRGRTRLWSPLVWYNDADLLVLGARARTNVMGWLDRGELGLVHGVDAGLEPGVWLRWRDPIWWRAPRRTHELAVWHLEGRTGASVRVEWDQTEHLRFAPERISSLELTLMDADAAAGYLLPGRWTPATTAELELAYQEGRSGGRTSWRWRLAAAAGGYALDGRPEGTDPASVYARAAAELEWGSAGAATGPQAHFRAFAGGVVSPDGLPVQRRVFVAGAGPLAVFWNPFLRSRGALLRRPDVHYFAPGGGGLRAYRPELNGRWAMTASGRVGVGLELGPLGRLDLTGFVEGGYVDGRRVLGPAGPEALGLLDLGPGVRLGRRVADAMLSLGVDFPIFALRPQLATRSPTEKLGFRWAFTLGAGF